MKKLYFQAVGVGAGIGFGSIAAAGLFALGRLLWLEQQKEHIDNLNKMMRLMQEILLWIPEGMSSLTPAEFEKEINEKNQFLNMALASIAESDPKIRLTSADTGEIISE